MQRTSRITVRCTGKETQALAVRSAPAVVPQIDHRIGKGLECVVQLTETVKAQQQAPVSSQPNSCSMVRNRSSKMAGSTGACVLAWVAFYRVNSG